MNSLKSRAQDIFRLRFVREIAILQSGMFVPLLCGFLSSILYARLLGLTGYGTYAVVLAFTGVIGLFTNLGQRFTTLTFLAEAYGRKDQEAMRNVLQYYILLSFGTIFMLALLFVALPSIALWLYHGTEIGQLARLVLLASMFDPLFILLSISLQTVREIRFLTIIENTYSVVQLSLGIFFVMEGMGPAGLLVGSLLTSVLSMALAIILYPVVARRHGLPSPRDIGALHGLAHLWTYAKSGLWIAIDKSLSNLYPNVFLFILSLHSSQAIVGLVRLAFKFASLPASYVLSNISRLASSVVPSLVAKGTHLGRDLIRLLRYSFLLHWSISLLTAIVVPLLFPIIYGKDFGPAIYPFWIILASQLFLPLFAVTTPLFRLYGKVRLTALCSLVGTAAGLLAFLLLTPVLQATWALYIAICLYQLTTLSLVFPAVGLLRTASRPSTT